MSEEKVKDKKYKPIVDISTLNGDQKKAFEELRMTSHWPHKVKLFPKNPRTYGRPLPTITPIQTPVISALGRRLAGY